MKFDVSAWADQYLEGSRQVASGNGQEIACPCPWCDKPTSFYVNSKTGAYVCYRCEERGYKIYGLVAQVMGMSFSQARNYVDSNTAPLVKIVSKVSLLDRIALLRDDDEEEEEEDEALQCVPLPRGFVPIFSASRKPRWMIPQYMVDRGIKKQTARAWGMGYGTYGMSKNRLIIPVKCPAGESWTGRDMTGDSELKYYNPKGVDQRRLLIGWHVADLTRDIVLCEGPLDAVRLSSYGISALALGGKVLHDEQVEMLKSLDKTLAVTVMLDPEELKPAFELASHLVEIFPDVYIARLPAKNRKGEKLDPGCATRKQAQRAIDFAVKFEARSTSLTRALVSHVKKEVGASLKRKGRK